MKFGLPLRLTVHPNTHKQLYYLLQDMSDEIILTVNPNLSRGGTITLTLTCEAYSLGKAKILLEEKFKKLEFCQYLYPIAFTLSARFSEIISITETKKLDLIKFNEIASKIKIGQREKTIQNALLGLNTNRYDHKKYFTDFADIINILDDVIGKGKSELCSVRNLISHPSGKPDDFEINIRKSQELGLNLQTEDRILIPNSHNVTQLKKMEHRLRNEIIVYYQELYRE